MDMIESTVTAFGDVEKNLEDTPYFRIPSSPSSFFALATLSPPSPSPSISTSSIHSLDFDDFPIFFVDSVAQSSVESSPATTQSDSILRGDDSSLDSGESLSSVCSFGTFGPRRDAPLYGLPIQRALSGSDEPTYLNPLEDDPDELGSPAVQHALTLNTPPGSMDTVEYHLVPSGPPGLEDHISQDTLIDITASSMLNSPALMKEIVSHPHKSSALHERPQMPPTTRSGERQDLSQPKNTILPQRGDAPAIVRDRRPGAERKPMVGSSTPSGSVKSPPRAKQEVEAEFVWLHGISIDLLVDQEGFRSATPSFRYSGVNRSKQDQTTCTVTFRATSSSKQGFHFHYNPFDSSPILRRVTIHGEETKDYISKQAQLTMKANGVYSVHGAEISSISTGIHSRIFNQLGHDPDKLDWEFQYLVEDRVDAHGRVMDGEKKFVPLTFTCSPWLLHPSQGKRVNLIHIFKKGVSAKLTAEKFSPLPAFNPRPKVVVPEIVVNASEPGSPFLAQDEVVLGSPTGTRFHRRARSHAVRDRNNENQQLGRSAGLKGDGVGQQDAVGGSASLKQVNRRARRASSAGEGSRLSMSI